MRVSLVCVAKNEDRYVSEWLDYHTKLGFDEIFMFQNDWRCSVERENLTKLVRDGVGVQVGCYNEYLKEACKSGAVDWVAFLDIDEFIVLKRCLGIKEFLADYSGETAVGVNWYFFGNSGLSEAGDGLLGRFRMRCSTMDRHIKSIVNVGECAKAKAFMRDPHALNVPWTDTLGSKALGPFNEPPNPSTAQINHYWAKTLPEFREKVERGRATCSLKRSVEDYNGHLELYNEVEDLLAYQFLYGDDQAKSTI